MLKFARPAGISIGEIIEAGSFEALADLYHEDFRIALVEVPAEAEFDWIMHPVDGPIAATQEATYYVDDRGRKFAAAGDGRQELQCVFSAAVERQGGAWVAVDPLATLKTRLAATVDEAAERERQKYITPGAGQAMTYQAKLEEARAALADGEPDPEDYPLLAAEIGITAPDLASIAAVVMTQYHAWKQIGAAIEAVRLGAKKAIDEAVDAAAAQAVFAAVEWPAPPT